MRERVTSALAALRYLSLDHPDDPSRQLAPLNKALQSGRTLDAVDSPKPQRREQKLLR